MQWFVANWGLIQTRLYAALPRASSFAAWPAWPAASRGLGSLGGFAARGFAAAHGCGHVPTTINIEMIFSMDLAVAYPEIYLGGAQFCASGQNVLPDGSKRPYSIHIQKERQQAMNRAEGSYQLSHAYDLFVDTASSRRAKNRKNWVPASSDEGLW